VAVIKVNAFAEMSANLVVARCHLNLKNNEHFYMRISQKSQRSGQKNMGVK